MDTGFRLLTLIALGMSAVAYLKTGDTPALEVQETSDLHRRLVQLEREIDDLKKRPASAGSGGSYLEGLSSRTAHTASQVALGRDQVLEMVRDEMRRDHEHELERVRHLILDDYGLQPGDRPTSPGGGPGMSELLTPDQAAEQFGFSSLDMDAIREHRERARQEMMAFFFGESVSETEIRDKLERARTDATVQEELKQVMIKKMFEDNGMSKIMALELRHDKELRERLGDEKFNLYKANEDKIDFGDQVGMNLNLSMNSGGGG